MYPIHTKNRVIGLLGGSFNPAHEGHVHLSMHALKALKLDEVWWLVSPHNPLKSKGELAAYEKRLQSAHDMAAPHRRIHVLDIEARHDLRYSWQTAAFLKRRFPGTSFVWLMGADNLAQFHRWRRWTWLLNHIPVAVFDRAPYSHTAPRSRAFLRGKKFLLKNNSIILPPTAPMLLFSHMPRHPLSATSLRKTLGRGAFLRHNKPMG